MKSYCLPLILSVLMLSGCGSPDRDVRDRKVKDDKIPVRLQELKSGISDVVIKASGQFTTDDETYLAFKTGGIIDRMLVREGDRVKAGQLLARLNPTEIESQVAQAQFALDKAKRDFGRAQNLFRDSVATLEQYQNAQTAVDLAERQLSAARFNLSYSEIRAVRSGFILKRLANEGQIVGPGNPVFLTNGANQNRWLLKVGVSDREWENIRVGDSATIHCDVATAGVIPGRVSHKSAGIDPVSGTFSVDLQVYDPGFLASGLFGSAEIRTTSQQSAWRIPYEALLDGHGRTGYVFISQDKQTVRKIKVTIGDLGRDFVTITEGLEGLRFLVIGGSAYLKDGSGISAE